MIHQRTSDLSNAGVSIWLDDLSRDRLDSGSLSRLISDHHVVGVTTNPTIFATAISRQLPDAAAADPRRDAPSQAYAAGIADCAARDLTVQDTIFQLMCTDVADACTLLEPVYEQTGGSDGRVSIEVSPELAHDTEGTVRQATQLWHQLDKANAMIKIPATVEGLAAVSEVVAAGISVNVTLIFSLTRYRQVINAYLVGLERARAAGHDLARIHSVASFFVSRVDTLVDARLDALATEQAVSLRGKAALANARLAYEIFEQGFTSERAQLLLDAGANRQRPLWASTGVKDVRMPDTRYVAQLVAPNTVNTMPEATLFAVADHAEITGDTIAGTYHESNRVLNELDALGIDYNEITEQLETEGIRKFTDSWLQLTDTVAWALRAAS